LNIATGRKKKGTESNHKEVISLGHHRGPARGESREGVIKEKDNTGSKSEKILGALKAN